jgi:hypothetical protein
MEKEHELPRQRPTLPTATLDRLLYERLDQALACADKHDRHGTELFVGVNGRSMEGKTKASVPAITACFVDLDLGGEGSDEALAALTSGATCCEPTSASSSTVRGIWWGRVRASPSCAKQALS